MSIVSDSSTYVNKNPKGIPMTKHEVTILLRLVGANKVITTKGTDALTNQRKNEAWTAITYEFNSLILSCPRSTQQLKLKWENLKKTARKKITRTPTNNLLRDETLERVAQLLEASCESEDTESNDAIFELHDSNEPECVIETLNKDPSKENLFVDCTPKSKTPKSTIEQQGKRLTTIDTKARIARNRAMANYYIAKKIKIELEIENLKLTNRRLELELENSSLFENA